MGQLMRVKRWWLFVCYVTNDWLADKAECMSVDAFS